MNSGHWNHHSWNVPDVWDYYKNNPGSFRNNYLHSRSPGRSFRGRPGRFRGSGGFRGNSFTPRPEFKRPRPSRETLSKRLTEEDIGVTKYISGLAGFNGIIKMRYADFQVSEINEDGEIAKLTNLDVPKCDNLFVKSEEKEVKSEFNFDILPPETWEKLSMLAASTEEIPEPVEIDVSGMDKKQRTNIHEGVKKAFGIAVVGRTVGEGDTKKVVFDKFRKGAKMDNRIKWLWPGDFLHFVLYKENCDTMDAASKIAGSLHFNNTKSMVIGYAGTKDRRAKTSQFFSVKRVEPQRLANVCKFYKEFKIGNFTFSKNHLKLGMLKGNKFRIALRNVTAEDDVIAESCEKLKNDGFLNYYGLQRFGTKLETPTYDIGLKLLQGKYKEAIDAFILESESCLDKTSRRNENKVLSILRRFPKDFVGALDKIPHNRRLLYVHSYQSLIWNRCVTERVKRFGLTPAVGDLVPLGDIDVDLVGDEFISDDKFEDGDKSSDDIKSEIVESDKPDEKISEKVNESEIKVEVKSEEVTEGEENSENKDGNKKKKRIAVKVLTEQDISDGKYTVMDIIMPLPGGAVEYPPNMVDYYDEILTKDGLTKEMKNKIKSYSMSGAYRHMVIRPLDLEWSCVRYNDAIGDLILSDWDELEGKELTNVVEDGQYKAVILTISLPSSSYATMALRELMKQDTSCEYQATQNDHYKVNDKKRKADGDSENGETDDKKPKCDDEIDKLILTDCL